MIEDKVLSDLYEWMDDREQRASISTQMDDKQSIVKRGMIKDKVLWDLYKQMNDIGWNALKFIQVDKYQIMEYFMIRASE